MTADPAPHDQRPVRRGWFMSLLWRLNGPEGRLTIAEGDCAGASNEYLGTVVAYLRAENDWRAWEFAAAFSDEQIASVGRSPIRERFTELAVPAHDFTALVADMDAALAHWQHLYDVAAALGDPDCAVPVPDKAHLRAAARLAGDPDRI